ncbi:MAG: NAD-dependent epimerase/dehydratase family protein, partial [Candidatus Thorarchaeota archaeon]
LLGSHLVPLLLERGHSVTVMTRSPTKVEYLESQGIKAIVGDLLEVGELMHSFSPHDVVVNIAMPIEFGRMSKAKFHRMSDNTTRFVSNALAIGTTLDCPTILTLGTSYQTGPDEVADESWPIMRFGMTLAGADADVVIQDAIDRNQPLIQMIPGQIYGPGGNFLKMYQMMESGRFGIFGKGDNYIPRIHVEDCASAFLHAIEKKPVGEKFIIADDTPCTTREFMEHMAFCAGRSKPRTFPRFIARLILGKLLLETMEMNCTVSNDKAKRELEWILKYPSYREGLAAVIKGLQNQSTLNQPP